MSTHSEWPFDQAPNVAAITTRQVLEGAPVLVVSHYDDDDSWGFFCGTTEAEDDGRVIGMGTALRRDPTLRELADLPPGWSASRPHPGAPWSRRQDS